MKIQISQNKIVKDALVVWNEYGPEVDIVMDLKNLTFKENSIEEIYSFHVLDHLFPDEVLQALVNWKKCLSKNGKIYNVVDDFEYIVRGFIGNDLSIEIINELHNHPTQFTKESLLDYLTKAGFKENSTNMWFVDVPDKFPKKHYELVFDTKNE